MQRGTDSRSAKAGERIAGVKRKVGVQHWLSERRWLQLAGVTHDIGMAAVAFYAAYAVIIGYERLLAVPGVHDKALLFVVVAATSFFFSSLNRGSWRYASIHDLFAILRGSFVAVAAFTIILFMLSRADNLPRSVPLLTFVFLVCLLSASRIIYRVLKENGYFSSRSKGPAQENTRNVLLYGANVNAESFIRAIRRAETAGIRVVGIIDDLQQRGSRIQGVPVLGSKAELLSAQLKLADKSRKADEIVVTDFQMDGAKIGALVSLATQHGLDVTRIPNLSATSQLRSDILATRPIELSDLLGRAEIRLDTRPVAQLIQSKTVFVTGAGGSIGGELVRQIAPFAPKRLIITDISEFFLYAIDSELRDAFPDLDIVTKIADIRDFERIDALFESCKPDVIFHAAALKHVPLLESNVLEGIKTNVLGTKHLADLAVAHGVGTFVQISTDKAVKPTNVMGATKRVAEAYCQAQDISNGNTRFKTVRFGNVLGSNGSVVPRFTEQIAKGGPVTVTHEAITRFFMTIPEAVRLVLQASGHGMERSSDRGRILVLDMGEPVKILDLAHRMIELAGYRPGTDIKIEITGLRPGEKLYEELFDPEELVNVANGAGYLTAAPRVLSYSKISASLADLEAAVADRDEKRALACLRQLVPEYHSETNSSDDNSGDNNIVFLEPTVAKKA